MEYWCLIRVLQKIVELHVCPRGPVQMTVWGHVEADGEQKWLVLRPDQLKDQAVLAMLQTLNAGLRILRGRSGRV